MAIPRRISLLEESRNQGMAKYHSSGIEEGKFYSSGIRGVKKGPGPRGSRDEEFLVPSLGGLKTPYNFTVRLFISQKIHPVA